MKNFSLSLMALSMLLLNVLVVPSVIQAQTMQDTQTGQGTTNDTGTLNTTDNQTGTTDDNDASWLWWLLPLIAIPVIYLLTRKNDNRDEYRDERRGMAGAKGGRSSDRDENEE